MEKDNPCKQTKSNRKQLCCITQNRLQDKNPKGDKVTMMPKGVSQQEHKEWKCTCTQRQSSQPDQTSSDLQAQTGSNTEQRRSPTPQVPQCRDHQDPKATKKPHHCYTLLGHTLNCPTDQMALTDTFHPTVTHIHSVINTEHSPGQSTLSASQRQTSKAYHASFLTMAEPKR